MHKILIANRGEIAVRIIRTCKDLGIATVAVYSDVDAGSYHTLMADEAICIGPAPVEHSYCHLAQLMAACEITRADALHPGYGFLSEDPKLAEVCALNKIQFLGPKVSQIALFGDKLAAKCLAQKVGCPVIPGPLHLLKKGADIAEFAKLYGYPVMLKGQFGGGGRSLARITHPDQIQNLSQEQIQGAYLEKIIENGRHVEFQILGDQHGQVAVFPERDCTTQRRHQKLIEETPCPIMTESLRQEMGDMALKIAEYVGYQSLGTVEFLLTPTGEFYFLEVNPRIQVEHTITEQLLNIDLVEEQLLVAQGDQLPTYDMGIRKHVTETRINAEDPEKAFCPCPGWLECFIVPNRPHVRVDTGYYAGCRVTPYYDSLLAKVIVTGSDRQDAIRRSLLALEEFTIGNVQTTRDWCINVYRDMQREEQKIACARHARQGRRASAV